jgi:uncharacterized protein YjbJ (UPF0337 family)
MKSTQRQKQIRRKPMNNSTKDEIEGSVQEAKGSVKEKAGQVTNRPALTAEGKAEKIAGRVQKEVGQIEEVLEKWMAKRRSGLNNAMFPALRVERNDFRRAAVFGSPLRRKGDPHVDTDYHLGVAFRGWWRVLRP